MYGGSPMYVAHSPQYRLPLDPLGPTPPPADLNYSMQFQPNVQQVVNPPNMEWNNMPSTSAAVGAVQTQNDLDSASGISSLLNLDNQQLVQHFNLNSQELASYNIDPNNLSEEFSSVCLTDGAAQPQEQNMTDSLTRLANSTIDKICEIYSKQPQDGTMP